MIFLILILICVSFVLVWAATAILKKFLLRHAMLDQPNDRSLHSTPVPRGGGLAVVGVILLMSVIGSAHHNAWSSSLFLIVPLAGLMLVSWLDDRGGVAPLIRLAIHLLAALIASFAFSPSETLFGGFLPLWLDRALMILGWAWFMNLYNFMDGIDGITGSETSMIGLGVLAILFATIFGSTQILDPRIGIYAAMLVGAGLGFLMLNWHPAKIFLGDIGSVPLGFLTGYILLAVATQISLLTALILPLYYLADSGITLGRRLLRGEKIWQAHRQHLDRKSVV